MLSAHRHPVLDFSPGGAGKYTFIDFARMQLQSDPCFHFARQVITRLRSIAEDHGSVDVEEFQRRASAGMLALNWHPHELFYGITIVGDDELDCGAVALADGSRTIVRLARNRHPELRVVNVTAQSEVLSERRESEPAVEAAPRAKRHGADARK
ncbi:hypothetical protein A5906_13990 [Bradyrhizobium sacchari]|uniref:hypothetical protein n=1 Tax=Bradyrhizobium sacchari TaxID=1399419 RepID=UPI0009B02600|nr:hypothetical protein [Bradyrhizobium sacchari]OPY94425.1 hypothetical protein A5906_13990 [Bradyrhizobium sacchari]